MFRRPSSIILVLGVLLFAACGRSTHARFDFEYMQDEQTGTTPAIQVEYPRTRFIVFSDPHYYHPSLGTSGPEFQDYIENDRKLLAFSDEILNAAAGRIQNENADFIIIPGDLTKDGERINHEHFAEKIEGIHSSAKVYVVPGNHDVKNGHSYRYTGEGSEPVENVSPEDFREIYADFGYGEAVDSDSSSLSYAVEPVDGLLVLAIDSTLWRENEPREHPETDGRLSEDTALWIESVLIRARKGKKAVIAFMHHGLIEHYPSNEKYYGDYVIDNSDALASLLAHYGVRLVFTGHFHAQDITVRRPENSHGFIFDVETGSLVTYPCPYRIVTITGDQTCRIRSRFIESIESMKEGFAEYAEDFAFRGTVKLADDALDEYWVSLKGKNVLSPEIAEAYIAHLEGDEIKPDEILPGRGIGFMGRIVRMFQKDLVEGWWTDLPPQDNRIDINLKNGSWETP